MDIKTYQTKVWDLYASHIKESPQSNLYLTAKLASEASELLAVVSNHDFLNKDDFLGEVSDNLWYLVNLCTVNQIDVSQFGRESALFISLEEGVTGFNILTGKFLGELCKQEFHGKKFHDDWISIKISQLVFYFNGIIVKAGFSIEDICEANIAKLSARHGQTYNKDFYQKS